MAAVWDPTTRTYVDQTVLWQRQQAAARQQQILAQQRQQQILAQQRAQQIAQQQEAARQAQIRAQQAQMLAQQQAARQAQAMPAVGRPQPAGNTFNIQNPPTPEQIGQLLRTNFSSNVRTNMTWDQALQTGTQMGVLGQIISPADIQRIPKDQAVRAIFIPNGQGGGTIRWGTAQMNRVLAGPQHDYFICLNEAVVAGSKQGYITVASSGLITIQ